MTNTLPVPSASEVTTLWRYTNIFIIIPTSERRSSCTTQRSLKFYGTTLSPHRMHRPVRPISHFGLLA